MPLTLCPNCRLPVNSTVQSCPLCTASVSPVASTVRQVPMAAAVAVVATTLALVARRWA